MLSPGRISFLIVISVLVLLYFLPEKFSKREYSFDAGDAPKNVAFPLDVEFPVVVSKFGVKGKTTLREIFEKHPQRTAIVNLWATWCPPCLDELPTLEIFNRQLEHGSKKMPLLVTISVDEESVAVEGLYKSLDFAPSMLVLHDKLGVFSKQVGTTKFPETYWVDAQGKILHKWLGPQDWVGAGVLATIKKKLPS